jgi:hypothetical protein
MSLAAFDLIMLFIKAISAFFVGRYSVREIPLLLKSWIGLAVTRKTLRKSLNSSKVVR